MDDVDYTSEQLMDDAPEPLGNDADFPPIKEGAAAALAL